MVILCNFDQNYFKEMIIFDGLNIVHCPLQRQEDGSVLQVCRRHEQQRQVTDHSSP